MRIGGSPAESRLRDEVFAARVRVLWCWVVGAASFEIGGGDVRDALGRDGGGRAAVAGRGWRLQGSRGRDQLADIRGKGDASSSSHGVT